MQVWTVSRSWTGWFELRDAGKSGKQHFEWDEIAVILQATATVAAAAPQSTWVPAESVSSFSSSTPP